MKIEREERRYIERENYRRGRRNKKGHERGKQRDGKEEGDRQRVTGDCETETA